MIIADSTSLAPNTSNWFLYIIRYGNDKLYTGITLDIEQRLNRHRQGKGAKCLRGSPHLVLVYSCLIGSKNEALKFEYRLKQLSKSQKQAIVDQNWSKSSLEAFLFAPPQQHDK